MDHANRLEYIKSDLGHQHNCASDLTVLKGQDFAWLIRRIEVLTEALEFYANGPCMTFPTIKPPADLPLHDVPKFIIEATVNVVRDVARKALGEVKE